MTPQHRPSSRATLLVPTGRRPARRTTATSGLLALLGLAGCPDINPPKYINTPPEVTLTAPTDGEAIREGETVTMTAALFDAQDDAVDLVVTFLVDDVSVCDGVVAAADPSEPRRGTATCPWTAAAAGHTVKVSVQDTRGVVVTDTVEVQVDANAAPTITIAAPQAGGGPYFADALIDLAASVDDAESGPGPVMVAWFDGDEALDLVAEDLSDDGAFVGAVRLGAGAHALRAEVTDPDGKSASAIVNIDVFAENTPPDCFIDAPTDGTTFALDEAVRLSGAASDTETESAGLTASLASSIDGPLPAPTITSSGSFNQSLPALSPGAHTLTLTVDDGWGGTCVQVVNIELCGSTTYEDNDGDGFGDDSRPISSCTPPEGAAAVGGDCDDADPTAYPGAPEVCDGIDNDCDSALDEADAIDAGTFYTDADRDGYGDVASATRACSAPAGAVTLAGDCDDSTALRAPGRPELCDGIDNDCDSAIDPDTSTDARTWYFDADGDTYAGDAVTRRACSAPANHYATATDCDDVRAAINPGAAEQCDGADNDCDGDVDEDAAVDALTFYRDADSDSYGDVDLPTRACAAPVGYVARALDCDDTRAAVNPVAVEVCNSIDDDCDGTPDEADAADAGTYYTDADGDTYGAIGSGARSCTAPPDAVTRAGDCDDTRIAVNPAATEVCNGIDDDCNEGADEATAADAPTWYADTDADTYGGSVSVRACAAPSGHVSRAGDCDDSLAAVNPAATEVCDSIDNDCNEGADEATAADAPTWYADSDADTYGSSVSVRACAAPSGHVSRTGDCDDTRVAVHPAATEVCNGIDDDCNEGADEATAADAPTWYADDDGDTYGDPSDTERACAAPSGHVARALDCDDALAAVNPAATERCNSRDDDCDTTVDEDDAADALTWYADADADTYGSSVSRRACAAPSGHVSRTGDCDDSNALEAPGLIEICDGLDNDCDGATDPSTATDALTWYGDADADTYGDAGSSTRACSLPSGYVARALDCDDALASVNPAASERCNGRDDDCDSVTDEPDAVDANTYYADTDGDSYGDPATTSRACSRPSTYVSDNTDCEPTEPLAYPGSVEWEYISDGIDQDCDGYDGCEDLDCDGLPDLVMPGSYDGDYSTASYVYFGAGGFSESFRLTTPTSGANWAGAADLDGDGFKEVLLLNQYNGSSYVRSIDIYAGTAAGPNMSARTSLPATGGTSLLIHDLDDDGDLDLFVVSLMSSSTSFSLNSPIYWNDAGTFDALDRTDLPTVGAIRSEAADLDADGFVDIVVCNHWNGTTRLINSTIYWGSSGGYSASDRTNLPTQACRDVGVADFDQDGNLDIVFANNASDTRHDVLSYIYWGSSTGYSTSNRGTVPTWGTTDLAIGDANADGLPDLAFNGFYDSTGNFAAASYTAVYYASTLGFSTSARELWDLRGARDVSFADLDSNGYPELLVARHRSSSTNVETNSMVYWGSVSGYTSSTAFATTGTYEIYPGDFDQDGVPDLLAPSLRDNSGYAGAGSLVYWGSGTSRPLYSSADLTELNTVGIGELATVVGDASW